MTNPNDFALVPASYLFLRRGDEVLLQQRANTGYMDGCWAAGAAGHIEPGETAARAAIREASEELGIGVASESLDLLTVMQRTDGTPAAREQRVDWFWTTSAWTGEPRITEPAKCSGLRWFHRLSLPAQTPTYEHFVLDRWLNGRLAPATSYGFYTDS